MTSEYEDESRAAAEVEAASKKSEPLPQRFLDLPVAVHATLGRIDLKLGDVFKLTVGSVVEVGRRITEPVDIIGNNNLIAKGQVVVRKGNYGVKILSFQTGSSKWE
ncbi:MAG: FliM/FliN family flagellar motor switch protein [Bryobacteraceae bacterium]|jgi:flagellar motor switch protein FliN/FliY